jgi:hypothetical protein
LRELLAHGVHEGEQSCATSARDAAIDLKVVQGLQKLMDALVVAFRTKPSQLLADHAVFLYQISSYMIAKLKQFQIIGAFLETTNIPVTNNHHWLLKRAFEQSGMKVQFPTEPFNFDDQMIQKRVRPPPPNYAYHWIVKLSTSPIGCEREYCGRRRECQTRFEDRTRSVVDRLFRTRLLPIERQFCPLMHWTFS